MSSVLLQCYWGMFSGHEVQYNIEQLNSLSVMRSASLFMLPLMNLPLDHDSTLILCHSNRCLGMPSTGNYEDITGYNRLIAYVTKCISYYTKHIVSTSSKRWQQTSRTKNWHKLWMAWQLKQHHVGHCHLYMELHISSDLTLSKDFLHGLSCYLHPNEWLGEPVVLSAQMQALHQYSEPATCLWKDKR